MRALRPALAGMLIAALAAGALHGVARNGFIGLDDPSYLTANRQVQRGLTAGGVAWAFSTTHDANWHPLTWLSHMLDVEMFGLRPAAHHLVSLALHVANALLLLALLRSLTGSLWRSAIVSVLFAVHPLHVESVAWASERTDVLAAWFALLAALAWLHAVRRSRARFHALAALLFALALMAKPMPVTLPFLLLLLDWWPLGRWSPFTGAGAGAARPAPTRIPPARLWIEKAPLFALAAASSAVTVAAQRGAALASPDLLPFSVRAAHALHAYAVYLGKTLWPFRLSVYYPHPGSAPPPAALAAAILLLGTLSFLAFRQRQRRPYLLVGWLWYLGSLVPVIGLVQVGSQAYADRFTYLPLVGVFVMAAWTAGAAAEHRASRRSALALAAALLATGLALRTANQVSLWRDDETLFGHALEVDPDNWMAHNMLGRALAANGDPEGAIGRYQEALRFNPRNAYVLRNLGAALIGQGRLREGGDSLRQALALEPALPGARRLLGFALAGQGATEEAVQHYAEAARAEPGNPDLLVNYGNALAALGRHDEALARFREAAESDPGHAGARYNLGVALASRGRLAEAAESFRRAIALDPLDAQAHGNLGVLYAESGRYREAREEFLLALELRPELAGIKRNLERLGDRGLPVAPAGAR